MRKPHFLFPLPRNLTPQELRDVPRPENPWDSHRADRRPSRLPDGRPEAGSGPSLLPGRLRFRAEPGRSRSSGCGEGLEAGPGATAGSGAPGGPRTWPRRGDPRERGRAVPVAGRRWRCSVGRSTRGRLRARPPAMLGKV